MSSLIEKLNLMFPHKRGKVNKNITSESIRKFLNFTYSIEEINYEMEQLGFYARTCGPNKEIKWFNVTSYDIWQVEKQVKRRRSKKCPNGVGTVF